MSRRCRCSIIIVVGFLMNLPLSCANAPMAGGDDQEKALWPGTGLRGAAFEKLPSGAVGQRIPAVRIAFVSQDGQTTQTVSTDENGTYRIALARGRYRVLAQHPDYESYSSLPRFIVVTGKGYQTHNIFLKKTLLTTILLLRHAEKATTPPADPPLTAAGQARATELVHVAEKAGVKAIYATSALRSKQTVEPLATRLNLPIETYASYAGLKESVLSNHSGEVVVVAGHADTLQTIVSTFGGDPSQCTVIGDEYDNLCVITLCGSGRVSCINLQYGAVSP